MTRRLSYSAFGRDKIGFWRRERYYDAFTRVTMIMRRLLKCRSRLERHSSLAFLRGVVFASPFLVNVRVSTRRLHELLFRRAADYQIISIRIYTERLDSPSRSTPTAPCPARPLHHSHLRGLQGSSHHLAPRTPTTSIEVSSRPTTVPYPGLTRQSSAGAS